MLPEPYLLRLTNRLARGLARLPEGQRHRHASWLASQQNADGGFPGREGESDLYYTGFALRSLAVLGALTPAISERASLFLRANLSREAHIVDFFSLLYAVLLVQLSGGGDVLAEAPADWPERVASTLEGLRHADGGYAKAVGGASGSTYHTFLVALCYELLGRDVPRPEEVVRFVLSRRRDDGGFVEIAPMKRSGTNPTAAGVGLLQLLRSRVDGLSEEVRRGVVEFLAEATSLEGGLRANTRVPLADLLSTFTGAWTLAELGALDRLDADSVRGYALDVERDGGGFHGGLWDEGYDVEYTFYGLGVLGLLAL